jgi:hypothetical protein
LITEDKESHYLHPHIRNICRNHLKWWAKRERALNYRKRRKVQRPGVILKHKKKMASKASKLRKKAFTYTNV